MTRFVLVRHGETEWNRVERFRGQADVPLNEIGLAQAAVTGARVAAEWKPAAVYSSPLKRALATAEAVAVRAGVPVQVHAGLSDIDFGELQGLTVAEAQAQWPQVLASWSRTPHLTRFPGGNNLIDLRDRAMAMVEDLTVRHTESTIVLIGHTVINRVILMGILGLGQENFWRLGQDNCAINVFVASVQGYVLVSMNDTCHLGDRT